MKGILRSLALLIAAAPFVLVALVFLSGTTSLAVVAPGGIWLLATIFVVPVLLGIVLWRVAANVR
jgi:hypothetical protein